MVERALSMREVMGSMPISSKIEKFFIFPKYTIIYAMASLF